MQGQRQVHAGEEDHTRPGWTTSKTWTELPVEESTRMTEMNGQSRPTSVVWPTLGLRTAKERNKDAYSSVHVSANYSRNCTSRL